eukprot:7141222-Prorocentrum_lima.AAC.1
MRVIKWPPFRTCGAKWAQNAGFCEVDVENRGNFAISGHKCETVATLWPRFRSNPSPKRLQ